MSNVVQNEISDSRNKMGKTNVNKRPSIKRSKVWDEFVEMEQPDGSKKAKCLRCGNELCCDSKKHGTNHLKRHLIGCEKKFVNIAVSYSKCAENHVSYSKYIENHLGYDWQNNEEHYIHQQKHAEYQQQNHELYEYEKHNMGYDQHNDQEFSEHREFRYDQQKNRELFLIMVIDNKTMLEHVENRFLKEFALSLQPQYNHVDRLVVEEDCLTFYKNEKTELKDKFGKLTSRVSFSFTNCFNPKDGNWHYCVTAHFVDNNFKLSKRVIGFIRRDSEISGVENFLNDWAFSQRILALTTSDYYLSRTSGITYQLGENLYAIFGGMRIVVGCIASCLSSIALEFTSKINSVFLSIKRIMTNLNESPEQMDSFNQIASEHNLNPLLKFNLNDQRGLGSEFNILHVACTYKKVLSELDDTNVDWSEVEVVVVLLNPINDMVLMLSSCEFPTINILVKLILQVKDTLSKASQVLRSTCKSAIEKALEVLDGYWVSCDEMVQIASLLDPRFKLRFIEHCNEKETSNKKKILERFHNLYSTYQCDSLEISTVSNCSEQILELKRYLESSSVDDKDEKFDVLRWWKISKLEYPVLSRMARDILAIPISSSLTSGMEQLEEIMGEISWSTIPTKMSEVLVCCNNWLRSNSNLGSFMEKIGNIKGKGQFKISAKKKIEKAQNGLCGTGKSGNSHLKHHLDQPWCRNSKGATLTQGTNFIYDPNKSRGLLVHMILSSKISFNLVNNRRFIEWARNLQPMYDPLDLTAIKRVYSDFYQIERQRLQNDFVTNLSSISLSSYLETFVDSYIYVTAHYIDNDFNLVRKLIGMENRCFFSNGGAQLERHIQYWRLGKKVLAYTSEKNVNNTFHELSYGIGETSLQCIVHGLCGGLSRIILNSLDVEVGNIKKIMKFLAQNLNVMETFNQVALKHKIHAKSYFQFYDEGEWYYKLNMLHDVLAHKDIFDALAYKGVFDACIESFFVCESWDKVEYCVKLLRPIYNAAVILSSSKFPTSNLFLKIVFQIHDVLSHSYIALMINHDHRGIQLLEKLLAYLADFMKDCNEILLIASIFDPRFKFAYLQRCYEKNIITEEKVIKSIQGLCIKYEIEVSQKGLGTAELARYLKEDHVEIRDAEFDFDILGWWNVNQLTYPILSRLARDILAIPVATVTSELLLSTPIWPNRHVKLSNELDLRTLEVLECSNNWIFAANTNNELEEVKQVPKKDTIDSVEKHIPTSYRCPPQQVRDFYSICYLEDCLCRKMSDEIVVIGDARLTAEKMQCLIRPIHEDGLDKWIPDEVINGYIGIIKNQQSSSITSNKVMMLSTFDTRLLMAWGSSMDKGERYSQRTLANIIERGNSFLQYELVFLPINVQDHWFVGVLNVSRQEFQILNSLDSVGGPYEETTHKLRSGIQVCINAAFESKDTSVSWRPQVLNWRICVIANLPRQGDICSCGLFALKYMQFWDGSNLTCQFTQDDIHLFRKQLVGELIFSDLNERKDIQDEIKKKYSF